MIGDYPTPHSIPHVQRVMPRRNCTRLENEAARRTRLIGSTLCYTADHPTWALNLDLRTRITTSKHSGHTKHEEGHMTPRAERGRCAVKKIGTTQHSMCKHIQYIDAQQVQRYTASRPRRSEMRAAELVQIDPFRARAEARLLQRRARRQSGRARRRS